VRTLSQVCCSYDDDDDDDDVDDDDDDDDEYGDNDVYPLSAFFFLSLGLRSWANIAMCSSSDASLEYLRCGRVNELRQ
jgi:hypothetical protein